MKTCARLRELKFFGIRMVEVRQRPHDGRYELYVIGVRLLYVYVSSVVDMETADIGQPMESASALEHGTAISDDVDGEENETKRPRIEDEQVEVGNGYTPCKVLPKVLHYRPREFAPKKFAVAKPSVSMKGHTAFLTFASCPIHK